MSKNLLLSLIIKSVKYHLAATEAILSALFMKSNYMLGLIVCLQDIFSIYAHKKKKMPKMS